MVLISEKSSVKPHARPASSHEANRASLSAGTITHYQNIDSTNDEAWRGWRTGRYTPGDIIVADTQTAGRGFDGSRWISDQPVGLWMSMIHRSPYPQWLPLLAAVVTARVLRQVARLDAHVKWPNDVFVGPRKIAGVLVESITTSNGPPVSVIGVGLNVNQRQFEDPLTQQAVSVAMLTRRDVTVSDLLSAWLRAWADASHAPDSIRRSWLSLTRMIGREFELQRPSSVQGVIPMTLTSEGALRVRDAGGDIQDIWTRRDLDVRGLGKWWSPKRPQRVQFVSP